MIGLMDANNFFVSCERLFRPDLVGKPVAVLSSNDGCIVARSNEVKAMGVPMGLPLFQAKQLVDMSQVTLFSSNFTLYRDISRRVMHALTEEVGAAEMYSVDEAFFTVSPSVTKSDLLELRQAVMKAAGIPVSIGLAGTKTLAKVASELAKKSDGVTKLLSDDWQERAARYACSDVWNIGRSMAAALRENNITTCAQFMTTDRAWVAKQFGIGGCRVYDELNGTSVHAVRTNDTALRQSITSTRSFAATTTEKSELTSAVAYHADQVALKLRQQKLLASRLLVVASASRHSDFAHRPSSYEHTFSVPSQSTQALLEAVCAAIETLYEAGVPYKKAGVVASGLLPESMVQSALFPDEAAKERKDTRSLDATMDALNTKFGPGTLRSAAITSSASRTSALQRSPRYTTVWSDIPIAAA